MTELIWEPNTTFDDWLEIPGRVRKNVNNETVDARAPLTCYKSDKFEDGKRVPLDPDELPEDVFVINSPIIAAPMQAVASVASCRELAKQGGLGVPNSSQYIFDEAQMIKDVKSSKAGLVVPDIFSPETPIIDIIATAKNKGYSTFPITSDGKPDGKLVGLLTKNDFSECHAGLNAKDRMIPLKKLDVIYADEIDLNLRRANEKLENSHHGSMPIIRRGDGGLMYMVFKKDIRGHAEYPLELVDKEKKYKVGAAVNTHDYRKRVPALLDAGADILFIDSSQGYSDHQLDCAKFILKNFPGIPIIGGNICSKEGFLFLVNECHVHGIKIGMGPGSICTTRVKFRKGRGQATAIQEIAQARNEYFEETGIYFPLIADGGISKKDHYYTALGMGADSIMVGREMAKVHESPTEVIDLTMEFEGRTWVSKVKPYWGEASERAGMWRKKRNYSMRETEGIEGYVPYAGYIKDEVPKIMWFLRESMAKSGKRTINEIHSFAKFQYDSESSKKEGRPHDIVEKKIWAPYSVAA